MTIKINFVLSTVYTLCYGLNFKNLEEKFHWKTLDYKFDSERARSEAIEAGTFIPANNIPFGIEVWADKVFVTVPRRNPGIPSTLNYVNLNVNDLSPQLNPYPDWKSNNLSSRFLISTYRINVDICDRLWTIDTGSIVDFDGNGERIHTPRIRVFNLKNNSLIFEYILKTQDYVCDSSYTSIIADVGDTCERTFAYAVDPGSNALLVYSLEQNDSWRIRHPYFNPDPMQTEYKIGDLEFQWDDGIFGLALGEKISSGFRNVYIHAMSNLLELSMSTQLLQNKTASSKFSKKFLKILGSRSPTYQAAASAYDERSGILFYTLVNKNGIGCWNSKKYNYYAQNVTDVAAVDNISLVYSSDVKIDKISNLWLISNRLPFLLYKEDKVSNEVKFRIFTSPVRQVVKNTACEHNRFFWSRKI